MAASNRITVTQEPLFGDALSPLIYGEFIELLNDLIPGMWAEKVQDRSFDGVLQPERVYPPGQEWVYPRWKPFVAAVPRFDHWPDQPGELEMAGAGVTFDLDPDDPCVGRRSARVIARRSGVGGQPFAAGIVQENVAVRQGQPLNLEVFLRGDGQADATIHIMIGRNYGVFFHAYAAVEFSGLSKQWQKFCGVLTSSVTDEHATLAIGISQPGVFWIDKVSLMAQEALHCHGWRPDVVEAVRALKSGVIRFGGSSLIYYDWRIGVGPRDRRVPFENRPWGNMEENDVGLHEFLQFCELVNAEPLICLNSNSATVGQILEEIEYCNGPADSHWGSQRAAMGHPAPFNVQYWQIGNEQSGVEYEQRMIDYARAIRGRHPNLTLLASYPSDNILFNLSDEVDYVCPHIYDPFGKGVEDDLCNLIDKVGQAKNRRLKIAVTEWNHTGGHWGWARSWLLTHYNALNAARMFNLYQRHGDRVRIANRSNMTNSCNSGTIQTSSSDIYFTPTYYVQRAYAHFAGDRALEVQTSTDEALDVVATLRQSDGELALFVVNYTDTAALRKLDLQPGAPSRLKVWTLAGPSLDAVNSFAEKGCITPHESELDLHADVFDFEFPPYSVTVLRV